MSSILQDLRYALRSMSRQRTFSAVAILTLAFGLGANTAIFSVVNAVLLRPLSFARPDRLVVVSSANANGSNVGFQLSYLNIADLNVQMKTLTGVGGFLTGSTFLMEGPEPEHISGAYISANLLPLLGVKPAVGRVFTQAEDREGGTPVIMLSHRLWVSRFGRDPQIIGRQLRIGTAGINRTVIGIMPEGFKFPTEAEKTDFWIPITPVIGKDNTSERASVFIDSIARLRDGVNLAQARAEANAVSVRLERMYPRSNTDLRFQLTPMQEAVVKPVRPALLALLAAVGVVLLIACANVANLLLARAATRHKEISIRTAVGASRGRIVRQLLLESVLLSLIAGACGLLLAVWGVAGLMALAPRDIPRLDTIGVDGTVLAFTLLLSLLTGIVFGLAPALAASKADLNESLKEGIRGSTEGRRGNRIRDILVAAEIGLSVLLLAGAGLLLRSFLTLSGVDPGFDYRSALVVELSARAAYDNEMKTAAFFKRITTEMAAIPGVTSVGGANHLPLGGNENVFSYVIAGAPPVEEGRRPNVTTVMVTPNYFRTMGMRMIGGRDFTGHDDKKGAPVIIVSESFARRIFPNGNALGQRMSVSIDNGDMREIVGVVGDVRFIDLNSDPKPMVYLCQWQIPSGRFQAVLRSPQAASLMPEARAVMRRIDPQQPIIAIRTLEQMHSASLANRKFILILIGALAALALSLAAVGIYSIMSYTVTQRTSEIGIRMALGAEPRDVSRLIVGQALRLVGAGVGAGVIAAFAATRLIRSMLYGTTPNDPVTFISICVAIVAVAVIASWIPARRAASVDPLVAIRYD